MLWLERESDLLRERSLVGESGLSLERACLGWRERAISSESVPWLERESMPWLKRESMPWLKREGDLLIERALVGVRGRSLERACLGWRERAAIS